MSKMKKFFVSLLVMLGLVSLAGCSSAGKIKRAFEKADYKWNVVEVKEATKELGIDGVFWVQKGISYGIIVEFSGKKAEEALDAVKDADIFSNKFLNEIVESFNDTPVTNGNCMVIALSKDIVTIFNEA